MFKIRKKILCLVWLSLSLIANAYVFADETEMRRVDISVSIFPRVVAVDNDFRQKLSKDNQAKLLFVYDAEKERAQSLAKKVGKEGSNIGGMTVITQVVSVNSLSSTTEIPIAIFIAEKLNDAQLAKVIAFAEPAHRLVFSPFSGDVERGVMVGISVTNRVKPYFNLASLRRSKVVINALLMKMSKRYE